MNEQDQLSGTEETQMQRTWPQGTFGSAQSDFQRNSIIGLVDGSR